MVPVFKITSRKQGYLKVKSGSRVRCNDVELEMCSSELFDKVRVAKCHSPSGGVNGGWLFFWRICWANTCG